MHVNYNHRTGRHIKKKTTGEIVFSSELNGVGESHSIAVEIPAVEVGLPRSTKLIASVKFLEKLTNYFSKAMFC